MALLRHPVVFSATEGKNWHGSNDRLEMVVIEAALHLVFNRFPEAGGFGHKIGQNGEVLGV